MSESKKQNFLQGTALLALSTAIVKVIGAIYKIPLNAIIGTQGFSYYFTAYEIYNVLLMISTAGLPVAMSRMISQANSLGHRNQVRRIYDTSRGIFLALGFTGSALMTLFCRQLAAFQNQPDAWAAIGALGPCVLLICITSTFRGFFQGHSNMLPTSVSQVIEAIVKLAVGMLAALLLMKFTGSVAQAAAGAIFGVTTSCLISSMYLHRRFLRDFGTPEPATDTPDSYASTARQLLIIAIPITIGSAGLQVLNMLETKIYMGQLLGLGFSQMEADSMKGIYNMCQTIYNMPCAFISPITISIIPAIASSLTLLNHSGARATEESAARVMGLVCMPCAFGLATLAGPVTALLGGYSGEQLELSTTLMSIMGWNLIFNGVVLLTNAIMQAHGHAVIPVVNMFVSGVLRLVVVHMLTGNPNIGIVGTPISSMLCFLCIAVLNIVSMRRVLPHPPAILKNLIRPFAAAALMGVFVKLCLQLLLKLGFDSRLILCAVPICVGVAVYAVAAVVMKAITREDCLLLPKGEKIAKLLRL